MKKALIIGANSQDGLFLTRLLLSKNYQVIIFTRNLKKLKINLDFLIKDLQKDKNLFTMEASSLNTKAIELAILKYRPDEIYYFASNHEVSFSLKEWNLSSKLNVTSVLQILNTIKENSLSSRFFFPSSSNIYNLTNESPQNELTPFSPDSLYGINKITSMLLVNTYREKFGIFASSGILYTHESQFRPNFYLVKKIIRSAILIKKKKIKCISLGNIDASRDWGFVGDYVEAMWLILQAEYPDDYIIGSGKQISIRQILDYVFKYLGLCWQDYLTIDNSIYRKNPKTNIVADISKIKKNLGWEPKTDFFDLLRMIIEFELKKSN